MTRTGRNGGRSKTTTGDTGSERTTFRRETPMAGKSWKSHQNTSLERDMDADHEAQLSEGAPRRDVDPAAQAARARAADDPHRDRFSEYGREWGTQEQAE